MRENGGLIITQRKFAIELLNEFYCLDCRAMFTPHDPALELSSTSGEPLPDPIFYRRLLGKMNFLTNTSPDLAYTIQHLS